MPNGRDFPTLFNFSEQGLFIDNVISYHVICLRISWYKNKDDCSVETDTLDC